MGLKKKTSKFLNIASRGSFLHLSTPKARKILVQILANNSKEPLEENPLEKESQIAEPESLPNPPQPSVSQFLSHQKRRKLHFQILCSISRTNFLLNMKTLQIITQQASPRILRNHHSIKNL
jgi:hypothetical protein